MHTDNQNVNEELLNNEQNTVNETTENVVSMPEVTETVVETTEEVTENVETPAVEQEEKDVVVETTNESATESVTETPSADVSISESDALAQVKDMLKQGKAKDFISRATPLELVFLFEQLNSVLDAINLSQATGLARGLKEEYDLRKEKDAFPAELEGRFSTAYGFFSKRKSDQQRKSEEENATRKRELVSKLKEAVDSGDLKHAVIKQLQADWKAVGPVSKDAKDELDRSYQTLLDIYYKRKSQEFELMDYDRKRNLERKSELIAKIRSILPNEEEALLPEVWRERQAILSENQKEWKEIGHVPKEDMERINMEYKEAVDNFFDRKREFLESQESGMTENAEKKDALLVKMLEYSAFTSDKPKGWEEATAKFLALQEEWKLIGKAPIEKNGELWKRFREIGNAFFDNKSNFFKKLEEERSKNLEIKKELCEKAEALKETSDWEKAAGEFKKLQDAWQETGPVPDRVSNKLWTRFRSACDDFFTKRRDHYKDIKSDEEGNLETKRKFIEEVKAIKENMEDREVAITRVKEIQEEWKKVGKVPIKQKDTIWDEFKQEVDAFFQMIREKRAANPVTTTSTDKPEHVSRPRQKNRDRNNENSHNRGSYSNRDRNNDNNEELSSSGTVYPPHIQAKISRLRKKISKSQEKVNQYSTNILYIAKGKSGDKLRLQIQAEIDQEVVQIASWKDVIKQLDSLLHNPNPELEEKILNQKDDEDDTTEGDDTQA